MIAASLLALAFFQGPVVINEFSYDDSGTDDREYIELYNSGATAVSISGWKIESRDANGTTASYTMPSTASVPSRGYLLIGSGTLPGVGVAIGATNLFPNDNDGIFVVDNNGRVVDAVIHEVNKGSWAAAAPYLKGDGVWGNFASIDNFEMSWQLQRDGLTFNNSRSFHLRPWTPGATNQLRPQLPYRANFDALSLGADAPGWDGSFRHPKVIDPTVAGSENTSKIPASPQGGRACIFWDNSGGGNAHIYKTDWVRDLVFEAYVYFDAKLENQGFSESWSVGLQGSCGTFYNQPDPEGGASASVANGNTGVSATFRVTDSAATLYLLDHNDGGNGAGANTDQKILGKIVLTAGVDDGWKRLRLTIQGNRAELLFGGTYGCGDGRRLEGEISAPAFGGVYIGYREFIQDNTTARPFTADDIQLRIPSTSTALYGTAKATTKGTPAIASSGLPVIGHAGFAILGSNLVPNSAALLLLGAQRINVDLGAVGGQSGAFLLTDPLVIGGLAADGQGEASAPLPLPCQTSLIGTTIQWQILDLDPALTVRLPFGTSQGLETKIGN